MAKSWREVSNDGVTWSRLPEGGERTKPFPWRFTRLIEEEDLGAYRGSGGLRRVLEAMRAGVRVSDSELSNALRDATPEEEAWFNAELRKGLSTSTPAISAGRALAMGGHGDIPTVDEYLAAQPPSDIDRAAAKKELLGILRGGGDEHLEARDRGGAAVAAAVERSPDWHWEDGFLVDGNGFTVAQEVSDELPMPYDRARLERAPRMEALLRTIVTDTRGRVEREAAGGNWVIEPVWMSEARDLLAELDAAKKGGG